MTLFQSLFLCLRLNDLSGGGLIFRSDFSFTLFFVWFGQNGVNRAIRDYFGLFESKLRSRGDLEIPLTLQLITTGIDWLVRSRDCSILPRKY